MVPKVGLEPTQTRCPQRPQRCASANSATSARYIYYHIILNIVKQLTYILTYIYYYLDDRKDMKIVLLYKLNKKRFFSNSKGGKKE